MRSSSDIVRRNWPRPRSIPATSLPSGPWQFAHVFWHTRPPSSMSEAVSCCARSEREPPASARQTTIHVAALAGPICGGCYCPRRKRSNVAHASPPFITKTRRTRMISGNSRVWGRVLKREGGIGSRGGLEVRGSGWSPPQPQVPSLQPPRVALVHREAVEESSAARGHQVRLAAASAGGRRVPGAVVAALLVRVAELYRAPPVGVAGVVGAGVIHPIGVGAAIGLRSGEDVVRVRHVADPVDDGLFLGQGELLPERVAEARLLDGVPVQLAHASADALPTGVEPRPVADAVTCVDGVGTLR